MRHLRNGSALLALIHLFILVISFLFIPEHCGWTHCPKLLQFIQSILFWFFLFVCFPVRTAFDNYTCFYGHHCFRQWLVLLEIFVCPSNKRVIYGPKLNFSNCALQPKSRSENYPRKIPPNKGPPANSPWVRVRVWVSVGGNLQVGKNSCCVHKVCKITRCERS